MIETTEQAKNGWHVVRVSGRADSEAANALETALRTAVEANPRVVAEFSALSYISSAGLRAIVQAARAAQARKSEFVICSVNPMVRKVFDVSGLDKFIKIHGDLPC